MLLGLLISIVWAANLIYSHVEPHVWYNPQERWVLGICFIAYLIAWIPVWLLPYDMVGLELDPVLRRKRCSEIDYGWLQFAWTIIYVSNLAAGYVTYDFARSYLDAGGFTISPVVNCPTTLEHKEIDASLVSCSRTSGGTPCSSK